MSLLVKIILPLSFNLSFNSTLQLINGTSSFLQKLLKYFNGTAIVTFFKSLFAPFSAVFSNNLALDSKDLKKHYYQYKN